MPSRNALVHKPTLSYFSFYIKPCHYCKRHRLFLYHLFFNAGCFLHYGICIFVYTFKFQTKAIKSSRVFCIYECICDTGFFPVCLKAAGFNLGKSKTCPTEDRPMKVYKETKQLLIFKVLLRGFIS